MKRILTFWLILLCLATLLPQDGKAQISENAAVYKASNLGAEGFPYYSACTYKGEIYCVQIYNPSRGSVRLIRMNKSNDGQLSFSDSHWTIDKGGIYQDAELVEWFGKLLVFYKNNTTGRIYVSEFDGNRFSDGVRVDDHATYANFAVVKYMDKLCLLYHLRSDEKIHIKYITGGIPGSDSGWTEWGTVKNGNNDDVRFWGYSGIQVEYTSSSTVGGAWDATQWIGVDKNGLNKEMLVVGRVKNGPNVFEAFTYEGSMNANEQSWNPYVEGAGAHQKAYHLKMVQAGIESISDNNTNPLQYIYASWDGNTVGEVFIKEFYPQSLAFPTGKHNYTDIPYGSFGATTYNDLVSDNSTSPTPGMTYRQKIAIIRGNGPGYHWSGNHAATLKSYHVRLNWQTFDDGNSLFKNPELRKFIRLEGILEGPPPSIVNNEQWYKNLQKESGKAFASSIFSMEKSTESGMATSNGYASTLKMGLGPNNDKLTAQFNLGYEYSKKATKETTLTTSYGLSVSSTYAGESNGLAFYNVPIINRYDFEIWDFNNTARNRSIKQGSQFNIVGESIMTYEFSLKPDPAHIDGTEYTNGPSNIGDPSNLKSWENREILKGVQNSSTTKNCINLGYNINTINNWADLREKVTTKGESSYTLNMGSTLKVPFFNLETSMEYEFTRTNTTTMGTSLRVDLANISRSSIPQGQTPYTTFNLRLYILTKDNSTIPRNRFYPLMKNTKINMGGVPQPMMIDSDGDPFILAWATNGVSLKSDLMATDNAELTKDRLFHTYTTGNQLVMKCEPNTDIIVYNSTGSVVYQTKATSDILTTTLPAGFYIVFFRHDNQTETTKVFIH